MSAACPALGGGEGLEMSGAPSRQVNSTQFSGLLLGASHKH